MDIFGKKKIKYLDELVRKLSDDKMRLLQENDKLRNQLAALNSPPNPAQYDGRSLRRTGTHQTKDTPDTRRSAHSVHTYETPASKPNDDLMGHVVTAAVINTITHSAVSSCYDASSSSSSYSSSSSCDSSSSSSSGGDF